MIQVYTVNAFTFEGKGGNPAGVVLEADQLDESKMQRIAKEVGFSETAFIMSSSLADFKIRFFTPNKEVDLCGHATIASFHVLLQTSLSPGNYSMETKAGIMSIKCSENQLIFMQQNKPLFDEIISKEELVPCLGISATEIGLSQVVSTGLRKIFTPVSSLNALEKIRPDYEAITSLAERYQSLGIYAFTLDVKNAVARCRNFAPVVGILEDAATGTSAAALTCYLFKHQTADVANRECSIQQGYSIQQPSEIITQVTVENNIVTNVQVAGRAFITGKKHIIIN